MSLSLKMITIDFNLDRDEFDKTKGTFLCMAKKGSCYSHLIPTRSCWPAHTIY